MGVWRKRLNVVSETIFSGGSGPDPEIQIGLGSRRDEKEARDGERPGHTTQTLCDHRDSSCTKNVRRSFVAPSIDDLQSICQYG